MEQHNGRRAGAARRPRPVALPSQPLVAVASANAPRAAVWPPWRVGGPSAANRASEQLSRP